MLLQLTKNKCPPSAIGAFPRCQTLNGPMADLQTSSGVMTSSQDHPLPAWYRLLPRPHTEALPSLARSSSLSQHHLVHAQSSDYPSAEDGLRRNTVHFTKVGSKPSSTLTEYVEREQQGANGEAGVSSPLKQAIVSSEMTEQQPHSDPSKNAAHSRENICLCPPDPKIPRPRNCETAFSSLFIEVICIVLTL